MKKQNARFRGFGRLPRLPIRGAASWPAAAAVIALTLAGATPRQACSQTLGQQVSPQPYTGASLGTTQGQQSTPVVPPVQYPGMGQSANGFSGPTGQQMSTGADVPQVNLTVEIVAGDLLDVMVFDTPDLSGRFRVNNEGSIVLPLVGPLHVVGLTQPEAAAAVARIYRDKQVMLQPQVTVFVAELASRGVTVTGEVRSPGIFPLTGPLNLNDLLARAGGLNGDASKTVSIVHRSDPGKIITVKLNVGAQTPESIQAAAVQIAPGDTIFVARSGIVYMIGDITRPGAYEVEHNDRLTLLDALALAGGPAPTAKVWDARLIRRNGTGREELTVDLKKILYGSGMDMYMTDGDILYIPVSQRKIYTAQAVQAVIGAATAYAIYKTSQL